MAKKKPAQKRPATAVVGEMLLVDTSSLVPKYEDQHSNPNKMDPERFSALVTAIKEEGFLQPILVTISPEGVMRIEDGHHRWWAALQLKLPQVSVVVKTSIDAGRATLLGIGMNRLRGELDLSTTIDVIREVQEMIGDLPMVEISTLTGFTSDELEMLLEETTGSAILEDGAAALDEVREEVEVDKQKTYTLELTFTDREVFKRVKRRLKKLGGGDLSHGVVVALAEDE